MILAYIAFVAFPLLVISTSVNCPQGWAYHPTFGACYGIAAGGFYDSWNSAEMYCNSFGAHLPSIHSAEEFEYIQSYAYMAGDNVWSGISTTDGGKSFKATDKTEVGYMNSTNWCFGAAPTSLFATRCIAIGEAYGLKCVFDADCAAVKMHTVCKKAINCLDQNGNPQIAPENTWFTQNCSKFNTCWKGKLVTRGYQCDAAEKCISINGKENCQSEKCDVGWRYYSNTTSCYKVHHNVNFDDGEAYCNTFDAHLTSIHSLDEDYFVRNMVKIGTVDAGLLDQTLIGFKINPTGPVLYTWTDGTPQDFNNGKAWPNAFGLNASDFYMSAMYTDNASPGYGYLAGQWFIGGKKTMQRNAVCKKPLP